MHGTETRQVTPDLRELVAEASQALGTLDADRLEELALSCQAFKRGLEELDTETRLDLVRQSREATADMAVFARVLDATRANRDVMRRLWELRNGPIEYSEQQAWVGTGRTKAPAQLDSDAESHHGDD